MFSHAVGSYAKLQYPECCNLLLSLTSSNLSSSSPPFSRALLGLCRLMSSPKAWESQSALIQDRLSACHWLACIFFAVVFVFLNLTISIVTKDLRTAFNNIKFVSWIPHRTFFSETDILFYKIISLMSHLALWWYIHISYIIYTYIISPQSQMGH